MTTTATLTATVQTPSAPEGTAAANPARRRFPAMAAARGVLGALVLAAVVHRAGSPLPFLPAGTSIWLPLHIASVVPCIPLGAVVVTRRKGDATHRLLGKIWAVLMAIAALSSFGLRDLTGTIGPIHVLSVLVLVTLTRGIIQARKGDIVRHQRSMQGAYIGLLAAGAFTFVPGRLLAVWLVG